MEKMRPATRPGSTSTARRRPPNVLYRFGRGPSRDIELFVARVKELSVDKLKQLFGKFGDVVNVQKPKTKPDIAFVSMDNFFEARKAIWGGMKSNLICFVFSSPNKISRTILSCKKAP